VKVAEECLLSFLAASFSTQPEFRQRVAKLADLEKMAALALAAKP